MSGLNPTGPVQSQDIDRITNRLDEIILIMKGKYKQTIKVKMDDIRSSIVQDFETSDMVDFLKSIGVTVEDEN